VAQLRPGGAAAEGSAETAEMKALRAWLEAPQHLSAVRRVVLP
jgi:hypothetical protein